MKLLIICSKGHWLNGWAIQPSYLETIVNVVKKAGVNVQVVEVSSLEQLQKVLAKASRNTLVWANAYWVNKNDGGTTGIAKWVEKYNLPLIGSNLETLLEILEKDTCQLKLKEAGIPTPKNLILSRKDKHHLEQKITDSQIRFPVVLKPTKESRSLGIKKADTPEEAYQIAADILKKFPHSNLIIEEFLASDDITCGFLKMGHQELILPSYNFIKGMDCQNEIFSEEHYNLTIDYEQQIPIEDTSIINQLWEYVPAIVSLFNIQGATRVDGRLDQDGIMNFFDINGLPGLNFPVSDLVKQCFVHFPDYNEEYLFEALIHTILVDSLLRYNMNVPAQLQEHNLFNLESKTVIRQAMLA